MKRTNKRSKKRECKEAVFMFTDGSYAHFYLRTRVVNVKVPKHGITRVVLGADENIWPCATHALLLIRRVMKRKPKTMRAPVATTNQSIELRIFKA